MLNGLHDCIFRTSRVRFCIVLLDNSTLQSGGPLSFDSRDHIFDKHLRRFHPIDSGDAFHLLCPFRAVLAASFRRLFEDERPDANLAIEVTIGASVPYWPSHSTHEHDFRNVPFSFKPSVGRRLTRNKVKVRVDLCHVEPLLVDVYVVGH